MELCTNGKLTLNEFWNCQGRENLDLTSSFRLVGSIVGLRDFAADCRCKT